MSTMDTTSRDVEIAAFAASVRRSLDDLPADEVDELVDGLEADLAEQAADTGGAFALPEPAAYADELRSAAGFGPRAASPTRPRITERVRGALAAAYRGLRSRPGAGAAIDFLISLRPAWWLLRGAIVFAVVMLLSGGAWLAPDLVGLALLAVCLIVSVQWGRGAWASHRWLRITRTGVSVAALALLPALVWTGLGTFEQWRYAGDVQQVASYSQPGLTADGQRVRNIFAYDSAGNPLTGIQLFDQDGRPLTTVGQEGLLYDWQEDEYFLGGGGPVPVAETGPGLQPVWNTYPLRELPAGYGPWNEFPQDAALPAPPFVHAPTAVSGAGTSSPSPTSSATPSSSPTPTEIALP